MPALCHSFVSLTWARIVIIYLSFLFVVYAPLLPCLIREITSFINILPRDWDGDRERDREQVHLSNNSGSYITKHYPLSEHLCFAISRAHSFHWQASCSCSIEFTPGPCLCQSLTLIRSIWFAPCHDNVCVLPLASVRRRKNIVELAIDLSLSLSLSNSFTALPKHTFRANIDNWHIRHCLRNTKTET